MRIGLDAMGGDRGTAEVVAGALAAAEKLNGDDTVVLVGDREQIEAALGKANGQQDHIEVVHAPDAIPMDAAPVETLRSMPDSSIAVMAKLQKQGELDAGISAGNTGACVAAAQMHLRRLQGVHRPGIAVLCPTFAGPVMICDVGANVQCRPQHLHQYGVMSSLYLETLYDVDKPRVGLLSIGEEESKGNELTKQAGQLMRADTYLNFIGNVESRDFLKGGMDVMVCDGFVGNVVLKLVEGVSEALLPGVLKMVAKAMPDRAADVMQVASDIKSKFDYNSYGGTPLLGVAGIWIICHGVTGSRGFMNAVLGAKGFRAHAVNQRIVEHLGSS
jgi:glycerol-3-phosphate acyltransferase PlsX